MKKNNSSKGFTLLEILLSIAIIALLAGIGMPLYESLYKRNSFTLDVQSVVEAMTRAEVNARGSLNDSTWGVKIAPGTATIFKGASYALRDATQDDVSDLNPNIAVGGTSEFVFQKVTGYPVSAGSVTLTQSNDTATITINTRGTIDY